MTTGPVTKRACTHVKKAGLPAVATCRLEALDVPQSVRGVILDPSLTELCTLCATRITAAVMYCEDHD